MAQIGLRDVIKKLSPPWLATGIAERFLYNIALLADALVEKLSQGIKARFPSVAHPTALPILSQDRLIVQGPNETNAHFIPRLQQWLLTWAFAGAPRGKLSQLAGYFSPLSLFLGQVNQAGTWDYYNAGADASQPPVHFAAANWNWDGAGTAHWYQIWPIIGQGSGWVSEGTWGDGKTYGDGGAWGGTYTLQQVAAVSALIARWKGAHAYVPAVIIKYDDTKLGPLNAAGAPMPAGTWTNYGADDGLGNYTPQREPSARYWSPIP